MYNGPQRKNQRLKNYDYSSNGFYFVTICTKGRENFFGEIIDGKMILNDYGKIAENVFVNLPNHYKNCLIDEYIFMPNHFHGIVIIDNTTIVGTGFKPVITEKSTIVGTGFKPVITEKSTIVGTGFKPVITEKSTIVGTGFKPVPTDDDNIKNHGLSEIIRGLKTFSSRNINNSQKDFIFSWQRSFFDVIIRNDEQLEKTRQYIIDNPLKWELDKNNPINIK